MKTSCRLLILASVFVLTGNAVAEEKKTEEKSPWTSSIELGFISTTGNTETKTSAGKADVVYEVDKWRHTGHAEGYGQEARNKTTNETEVSAERYQLTGKTDYKFNERNYVFGLINLQKDRFSGFEYERIISVGYGHKTIKQDNMELDLEIGPGIRFFKVDNGVSENEALLVLAAKYWWAITDSSKFTQEFGADIGENFTTTRSITGIQANINKTLALKFTYTIRNKSEVPVAVPAIEKTDTELAMTLVYTF